MTPPSATPPPAIRWIYAFADRPQPTEEAVRTFWAAVTGTALSPLRGEGGEFVTFLPPGNADPCVKHQSVAGGPGGTHVDLCVEDVLAFVRHARQAGAAVEFEEPGLSVLRSPAGLGFCVVPWAGERTPPPVVEDERLDQVCLDVGPAAYERELAFWAELTGWRPELSTQPEFYRLRPPLGLPVRFLVQRLDDEQPAHAHLDLAVLDPASARVRHEALGARFVAEGKEWIVMRDPSGVLYCLTDRDPRVPTGGEEQAGGACGASGC
ncbi:VOC family protein [Streptomyces sp. NPDC058373]|uniref:VOC family protein n=1 Tax=Streptomyces sp. NPDC058373 TaxID=3346465 RepID=UPI00366A3CFF